MAELLLGNLDKKTVFNIITIDGRRESYEQYFVDLNPILKSIMEDVFYDSDTLDVSQFTPDSILYRLDYGNLKIIEKWCEHKHALDSENSLKDTDAPSNVRSDVVTTWHIHDSWEIAFIDKMISIGEAQEPPFKLFIEILSLADFLGNQAMCHSLIDRWLSYLNSKGKLHPDGLSSFLRLQDLFDKKERDTLWNKYQWI